LPRLEPGTPAPARQAPETTKPGEPLAVYATQVRLGATQAIHYINQELGYPALRQTWNRRGADIVVRPTPSRILREARRAEGYVATNFVSFLPPDKTWAREGGQVVFLDPGNQSALLEFLRQNALARPSARQGRRRKYGTLSQPRSGGKAVVAAHELGHAIGLTHEDPGTPIELEGFTDAGEEKTITTGGQTISPFQREVISRILGIPDPDIQPISKFKHV